jgi:hypothetical protein
MEKEKHQPKKKKRASRYPFFDWRKGLTFAGQMGIAYLRHSLTLALAGAFMIASTIIITVPFREGLTPDFMSLLRLTTQTVSLTALIITGVLMIGLGLNALTTAFFMGFQQEIMDETELSLLIPRYLFAYNLLMMPALLWMYLSIIALPDTLMLCLTFNAFAVAFVAGDVARHAWADVANWYRKTLEAQIYEKSKPKHDLETPEDHLDFLAHDPDTDKAKRKH